MGYNQQYCKNRCKKPCCQQRKARYAHRRFANDFSGCAVNCSVQADPGRKKAGVIDWLILVALRILLIVGAGVMLSSAPGVKLWCYGLSIAIMTLLVVSMQRLNHFHNEFVTRPVPFFGKEAQS